VKIFNLVSPPCPLSPSQWELIFDSVSLIVSLSVSIDLVSVLFQGNNNASGQQIDQKSGQWFGATVRSSGPNGAIVVSFFNFCVVSCLFLFQDLIRTQEDEF
jgi:hypothetical protein